MAVCYESLAQLVLLSSSINKPQRWGVILKVRGENNPELCYYLVNCAESP